MRSLHEQLLKPVLSIKLWMKMGILFGFILILCHFFVSATLEKHLLFIGLAIIVSSITIFGSAVFLTLMQEVEQGQDTREVNNRPHLYLVKK